MVPNHTLKLKTKQYESSVVDRSNINKLPYNSCTESDHCYRTNQLGYYFLSYYLLL
jgi:hypothetical protein